MAISIARDVLALGRGRVGLLDGDTAVAVGIGLSGGGGGFGLLDGDALGAVCVSFARDGGGFGLLDGDTPLTVGVCLARGGFGFGFGDGDAFELVRFGCADAALALLLGHVDLRLVNGAGGGALPDGRDVAGFVGDVGDVDVQELKADLLEFLRHVRLDRAQEGFAVGVDLFDHHRGDDKAQLAEDDILRQLGDRLPGSARTDVRPRCP